MRSKRLLGNAAGTVASLLASASGWPGAASSPSIRDAVGVAVGPGSPSLSTARSVVGRGGAGGGGSSRLVGASSTTALLAPSSGLRSPEVAQALSPAMMHRVWRTAVAPEVLVVPRHALSVFRGHVGWVMGVAVSDDGRRVASCAADNTCKVWGADSGSLIATFEPEAGPVDCPRQRSPWAVSITGDGGTVCSGGEDGVVRVWSVSSRRLVHELVGHTAWVLCVSVANEPGLDGHILASGGGDASVRVWDIITGLCLHTLLGHTGPVKCVCVTDQGTRVLTGGSDGRVRVWDGVTGEPVLVVTALSAGLSDVAAVGACALLPNFLVLGNAEGVVAAWRYGGAGRPAEVWRHKHHTGAVRCVWVSEDGRFVFSGGEDGSVVRVGAGGDDPVALRDHEGPVLSVAASFDGTRAFSSGTDGTVRVWGFT